jgi:hypothetical protein
VTCLVFLEYELAPFAAKHPDDKVIDILRKTWPKMSALGHARRLPCRYRRLCARWWKKRCALGGALFQRVAVGEVGAVAAVLVVQSFPVRDLVAGERARAALR